MKKFVWMVFLAFAFAIFFGFTAVEESSAVELKTVTSPWLRLNSGINGMKIDPNGMYIAFMSGEKLGLNIVDTKTRNIYRVTQNQVAASYFWAPQGFRLFYRELVKDKAGKIKSIVKAYDCVIHKNVVLDEMDFRTGLLTFDPRDLRVHLLHKNGIRTRRIHYPDERLAKWQIAQRTETGKWVASQNGVLWVTQGGFTMRRMKDDDTAIESFDVSPDGTSIAWATKGGKIYTSKEGKTPKEIGFGRDPNWHLEKPLLLYAASRMVGNKVASYDIKVADDHGSSRYLTATQFSSERWPRWHPKGTQILYTKSKTTDIYLMDFVE